MDSLIKAQAYINGHWINSSNGKSFNVINPATGAPIGRVPDMERSDVTKAIRAAENAFGAWSSRTGKERAKILRRWFESVVSSTESLARIITLESGKPLAESRSEVAYGASFIEWFAEEAKRIYGDTIPATDKNKRIITIRQPIGVSAAITPWNFPLAMITRKASPALAAGCTMVIKPAESTPLTALALARLAEEAEIPAGVFNIITSLNGSEAGKEFCENPTIRKLSFTGSTRTGRILAAQCAGTVKKLSLELGGTSPFIVFDDASVDNAVNGVISSKFRNAGQTCICANLILVQEPVYDVFINKLVAAVQKINIGNGTEENISIGPLINDAALNKVKCLVEDAISNGAQCLAGGTFSGLFYEPTVLSGITKKMKLFSEEIFGPIAPVIKFSTEEEALEIANNSIYGLAAYFYSNDISRCMRVAESLQYGIVGVNEGVVSTEVAPFGGIKQSGIGREGSKYGIEEYTELKYICYGNIR